MKDTLDKSFRLWGSKTYVGTEQFITLLLAFISVSDCKARDKNGPFPGLKRGQSLQTKSLD